MWCVSLVAMCGVGSVLKGHSVDGCSAPVAKCGVCCPYWVEGGVGSVLKGHVLVAALLGGNVWRGKGHVLSILGGGCNVTPLGSWACGTPHTNIFSWEMSALCTRVMWSCGIPHTNIFSWEMWYRVRLTVTTESCDHLV